jgi:hypothetical protein
MQTTKASPRPCRRAAPDGERIETASNFWDAVTQAAASGFTLQPASSPGSYGWSCCAAYELPGVSRVYIYRRQSPSSCNDRLFQLRDLEFMLARDAFIGFTHLHF